MIYITQLIYIKPGKEDIFDQFEDVAIPLIGKYNGKLLFRLRPGPENFIGPFAASAGSEDYPVEHPYEIHLASFASEADFELFKADKERESFLHLKDESVRKIILIKGVG
jgi:hypothetical protein